MMKRLYLLTGAAGFLGSNICQQLLERGDSVRAFVLKGDPAVKYIPDGVEIFEGDLCSGEDCNHFLKWMKIRKPYVFTVLLWSL